MKLVALTMTGFVLAACAADGEVKVNASSNSDTKTSAEGESSASASAESPRSEAKAESTGTSEGTKTLGASAEAPAEPAAACPLVCFVANKGRAAPADEQRLQGELASELSQLRGCGSASTRPSLTLRFDSSAKLAGFGVDAERGNEGACVSSLRDHHPTVTYQGPATLRCSEKCPGDAPIRNRRRGPR